MPLTAGLMVPRVGAPPPAFVPDFYVSPTGSSSNDGSIGSPWSLTYALGGAGGAIVPGKQVALRGGTYTGQFSSSLIGTASQPIIVRQYPGERATIVGTLFIQSGSYTWFWGFELTSATPGTPGLALIYQQTTGSKLIHLVLHDAPSSGLLSNPLSPNSEIYGCLIYNNGCTRNLDHGLYMTNSTGVKDARDNIVFNNWKYGFHLNGNTGELTNLHFDGNVAFLNGSVSDPPISQSAAITLAGTSADGFEWTNNYTYETSTSPNAACEFGVSGSGHNSGIINSSVLVHYTEFTTWTTLSVTNNTFFAPGGASIGPDQVLSTNGALGGYTWTNNAHFHASSAPGWGTSDRANFSTFAAWKSATGLGVSDTNPGSTPTGTQTFVRPSAYETGRGHVIIYNWDHLSTVNVDLSTILSVGSAYQIKNAQDFYGATVLSGTYAGGTLAFPMAGITPVAPVGRSYIPAPITGPEFQVFIVQLQGA